MMFVTAWFAALAQPVLAATRSPSPSPRSGLGSTGSGPGFVLLALLLIGALLFSAWRLRRNR
jgi:hypothetical protein